MMEKGLNFQIMRCIFLSKLFRNNNFRDFFSSYNNMDERRPSGQRNNHYGYPGDRSRYNGKVKRKKSMAPKDITLGKHIHKP